MKAVLIILAISALPAHADIFVCLENNNKTVYQDEPCTHQTIRTIKNVPAPTPEERAIAQERIDQIHETSRVRANEVELERLEQEKREIELERIALEKQRIELLEQQALNERHPYPIYVNPRYQNRYGGHRFNRSPYQRFPNRPPRNSQLGNSQSGNSPLADPKSVHPPTVNPPNTIPANPLPP